MVTGLMVAYAVRMGRHLHVILTKATVPNSACPWGFYCSNGVKTPCPAGKSSNQGASSLTQCFNCLASVYYSTGQGGLCQECPRCYGHTFCDVKTGNCVPCADTCTAGYWSNDIGTCAQGNDEWNCSECSNVQKKCRTYEPRRCVDGTLLELAGSSQCHISSSLGCAVKERLPNTCIGPQ